MPDNDDNNVHPLFGDSNEDDTNEDWAVFSSDEDAEDREELDPASVAFMDQQAAEFNAKAEHEFADRYGFVHKCRCDQDFTEGKMVEVTECYANMTLEALDACAALYAENKLLTAILSKAVTSGINVTHIGGANVPTSLEESTPELPADAGDSNDDGTTDDHDLTDGFA